MCEWWDGPIRNPSTTNLSPLDMKVGGNGPTIHYVPCCPIVSCWRLRKAPFPNANTSMDDDVYLLSFFFFSTNPFSNLSVASQFKWSARGLISRDDAGEFCGIISTASAGGTSIGTSVGDWAPRWLSLCLLFQMWERSPSLETASLPITLLVQGYSNFDSYKPRQSTRFIVFFSSSLYCFVGRPDERTCHFLGRWEKTTLFNFHGRPTDRRTSSSQSTRSFLVWQTSSVPSLCKISCFLGKKREKQSALISACVFQKG